MTRKIAGLQGIPALRVLAGGSQRKTYTQRMLQLFGASTIVGLWTLGEASGTTCYDSSGHGLHGTYTGVQLAQPGVDRFTAAKYDGLTSYANIYSAGLASAFNGAEGTLACSLKISSAALWGDSSVRRIVMLRVDTNNRVTLLKNGASGIGALRVAGSVNSAVTVAETRSTWLHVAMTWSKSADYVRLFVNGALSGTPAIGLGTFSGALASTTCCIGAGDTTPANVWSGSLQYAMLLNRAATAAEITQMARAV